MSETRPLLIYLLLVIVIFWPLSFGIYALQYDAIDVYLPWRFYGSESLRQGFVPLWNPFQDGGYPMYADHQYSIWNPELFLISAFSRYNALIAQWLYLFYLTIAGLGFRYLLKQLQLDSKVWFIGGALFMLSGIMVGHAQSPVSILGAVWLPWALASYIKAFRSNYHWKDIVGLIVFMYLMLSSGYQAVSIMLFYVIVILGFTYLVRLWRKKLWFELKRFVIGHLIVVIALSTLLVGIVLSVKEVFPYLTRLSGLTLEETQLISFDPKSFASLVYPLASVQTEYSGTSATAQNIYEGYFAIIFFFIGIRFVWKKRNHELVILYVFGLVFGLASFGGLTPVQPFLVKFVPGFDQFYYAVFYRYFAWIPGLIVVCYGIQEFLEKGTTKQVKWMLIVPLVLYLVSIFFTAGHWEDVKEVFNEHVSASFRNLKWGGAVLLQAIIEVIFLLLVLIFVLLRKPKVSVVIPLMLLQIGLITQLNIPVTVHGKYKTERIDRYLSQYREGFSIPSNHEDFGFYEDYAQCVPIYRNQGNFTNVPKLSSWTSFYLKGRKRSKLEDEGERIRLLKQPLAYTYPQTSEVSFTHFDPYHIQLNVASGFMDRDLILQQANYPHWRATINGQETEITTANGFEQKVKLTKEAAKVDFTFENDTMIQVYYATMFTFLALLLVYLGGNTTSWSNLSTIGVFGGIFTLILFRYITFHPTPSSGYLLQSGEQQMEVASTITGSELSSIRQWLLDKERVQVHRRNADFDGPTFGLFRYLYDHMEGTDEGWICSKKSTLDTAEIRLNVMNPFSAEVSMSSLVPERKNWKEHLIYGFHIHENWDRDSVIVGMVVKRGEETIDFFTKRTDLVAISSKDTICTGAFLIPPIPNDADVKIWIWNMGHKKFSFSNFKVEMFEE